MPRSYQVTPVILGGGGDTAKAGQVNGRQANRESARRRPRAKPTSRTTPDRRAVSFSLRRISGVSRTAECCESQRFLEDHKQADLPDAWDNSHRRVSAEQFGDTASV